MQQIVMRDVIFKMVFLGAAFIATGGWIWLLYEGLKWVL